MNLKLLSAAALPALVASGALAMPMDDTPTTLSDTIVPSVFNPYYRQASTRVNRFFASGLVQTVPDLTFGQRGGTQIDMPFWNQIDERAQLLDDNDDLEIRKITSGRDVAVQHARALVYGATDLSGAFAGDDPMMAIGDMIGTNWSSEFNRMLIATLKGASAVSGMNSINISGLSGAAAYLDGESFIDATQTLGDNKFKIVAVAFHSAVDAWLQKNDLIEFIRDSEGTVTGTSFMGKDTIFDDDFSPASGGIYTSYLFGEGAVGFGEGAPKVPTATDRNELVNGGEEFLVTRRHFVLHPRGIKWNPSSGVPAKATPSDSELAASANWARVWEPKNIRIIRVIHKIG